MCGLYQNDIHMRTILFSLLLLMLGIHISAQESFFVSSEYPNRNELIAGIYNYITITAIQEEPIQVSRIRATLYAKKRKTVEGSLLDLVYDEKKNLYRIHPKQTGRVEFQLEIDGKIEIQILKVVPLPAVVRLGRHRANTNVKVSAGEFKAHPGIMAVVECCGFDAKCEIIGFDIVQAGSNNCFSQVSNKGGRYQNDNLHLIKTAAKGDIFIFRNIFYRCPGAEKQRADDFVIEIF